MKTRNIIIPALDNYPLAATIFEPENENIKGVVQFHCGTAIVKEYYSRYCSYLADHGYIIVLFDYRGIGGSRPNKMKGFKAYLREWAQLDMTGVLNWIAGNYPQYPRYIVAHSIGSQMIGLMYNHHLVDGIIGIALSTGYWPYLPSPFRYFCAFLWYLYIPLTTKLFGYAPAKRLGLSEDLPMGVATEWADWCKVEPYISYYYGKTIMENYYKDIRVPFKVIVAEDDEISTTKSVPHMLQYYKNAQVQLKWLKLEAINTKKIKHFGYFSSRHKSSIWKMTLEWLDEFSKEKSS